MNNSRLILRLLLSGGLNQIAVVVVGFIRIPLVISTFGTETFASYAAALGFWTLIAAIGESARQRVRILEFSNLGGSHNSKILWRSLGLAFLVGNLCAILFFNIGGQETPDIGTFAVAFSCGVLYVPFAMAMGRLEGQFKFATTNLTLAAGQVLGLLVSIWGCLIGQIWVVGLSVLVPFFVPGIITFLRAIKQDSSRSKRLDGQKSTSDAIDSRPLMLLVLFSETLVYSVDGALILMFASAEEAAIFAVLQRIVSVFAILPMVIAPLATSLNIREPKYELKKTVSRLQFYAGLSLSLTVMVLGIPAFNLLTQGQLDLSIWTLAAACTSGLILAVTTTEIQSATSSKLVRTKATTVSILAALNITLTVVLCQFIGAAAAFLSTGIGQIIYFLAVKQARRKG
jgi:hypothetical protein